MAAVAGLSALQGKLRNYVCKTTLIKIGYNNRSEQVEVSEHQQSE